MLFARPAEQGSDGRRILLMRLQHYEQGLWPGRAGLGWGRAAHPRGHGTHPLGLLPPSRLCDLCGCRTLRVARPGPAQVCSRHLRQRQRAPNAPSIRLFGKPQPCRPGWPPDHDRPPRQHPAHPLAPAVARCSAEVGYRLVALALRGQ